jgi:hypothetical protein
LVITTEFLYLKIFEHFEKYKCAWLQICKSRGYQVRFLDRAVIGVSAPKRRESSGSYVCVCEEGWDLTHLYLDNGFAAISCFDARTLLFRDYLFMINLRSCLDFLCYTSLTTMPLRCHPFPIVTACMHVYWLWLCCILMYLNLLAIIFTLFKLL